MIVRAGTWRIGKRRIPTRVKNKREYISGVCEQKSEYKKVEGVDVT